MNYYTPLTTEHNRAFFTALKKAVEIAESNHCTQILLVVPQKGTLTGVIEDILGAKCVSDLIAKKRTFLDPITFFLETRKAKAVGFIKGPVLAAYAYVDQLKTVEKNRNIPGIVLYSNAPEDIVGFKAMGPSTELKIV